MGTACEEHAFAHPTRLALPPPFSKLLLAVVAADEDQEAGDQRQDGEDEQAGRGLAGGFLDPADQVRPTEAGEIADRVDQRDGTGRRRAGQPGGRQGPEHAEAAEHPIAATVSTTIVRVGSVR